MHPYLTGLSNKFEAHSDPLNASAMKQYMKGKFDYFGIKAPLRKELIKAHYSESGFPHENDFESVIHECWKLPQREYQYFAMELAGRYAKKAELCRVDLYEYLVLHKSWWDTVDYIASNLVGVHFKKFPDSLLPYTQRWMDSGNIWLQRVCLLYQLKYRKNTDVRLMTGYIERLEGSKEFFINKAIGWILREYSKSDPDWVTAYVRDHDHLLSPLSKREAFKWLDKQTM